MSFYATKSLGFWQLVKSCFTAYVTIYKKAWQIILLAAIIFFVAATISGLSQKIIVAIITVILFLVLALLNAMVLHQGNNALSKKEVNLPESFAAARKRYLSFLVSYFVIELLSCILENLWKWDTRKPSLTIPCIPMPKP